MLQHVEDLGDNTDEEDDNDEGGGFDTADDNHGEGDFGTADDEHDNNEGRCLSGTVSPFRWLFFYVRSR